MRFQKQNSEVELIEFGKGFFTLVGGKEWCVTDVQEQNKLDSRGIQEQSYCLACSCGVWKREGNWSYPAQIQDLEQQAFLGLCTYLLWVPLPALLQEMNWLFLPFGFFPLSLLRISTPSSCYLGMTASVPLSQLHLLLQFWNCPMLPNLDSREKNSRSCSSFCMKSHHAVLFRS